MPTNVLVPRLGEGVEEVAVTGWRKRVGEAVNELEPLLEVESDKVTVEVPAPVSGVLLRIEKKEGESARVGELLAVIGAAGESMEDGESVQGVEVSETAFHVERSTLNAQRPTAAGFISPVVAKIAAERGVDLSRVKGTGLNGRITKNDVLAFLEDGEKAADNQPQTVVLPLSSAAIEDGQLVPHSAMRKSIAARMVESKRVSPHVLTVMEADMSRVVKHRAANKAAFERDGVHLTFTAYFMSAIVAGLKAYPLVNSSWTDEGVLMHKAVNIGMATSLGEEGLIVPVVKGADNLSLLAMARAVNDLASRARSKKLQPDEVKGGTFTLTNHGVSGSLLAFPIINQPQCGILGVGAMQKRAVVIDDAIAIRPMVYLSFAFDHRILDGASADWFLAKVKDTLENWT